MVLDDQIVWAWVTIALISTIYVFWDNCVRGNPETAVMRWAPDTGDLTCISISPLRSLPSDLCVSWSPGGGSLA
jgi:hypothetical protein